MNSDTQSDNLALDASLIGGGTGRVSAWLDPDLVVAAPAGIASVTAASAVTSAGRTVSLVASQDMQFAAQASHVWAAHSGVVLYTYGKAENARPNQASGIKLHAASGNLNIQSQSGATQVVANGQVQVTSAEGMVRVTGLEHILLTAAGAALDIQPGSITLKAPGKVEFKATAKQLDGPASSKQSVPLKTPLAPPIKRPQHQDEALVILPARYTVCPKTNKARNLPDLPEWAKNERVTGVGLTPDLKYALRTLRKGYIYLYYSDSAQRSNLWECYAVSDDGCLKLENDSQSRTFYRSRIEGSLALPYLVIPQPLKAGEVWIAFSEDFWSQSTLDGYAKDTEKRRQRMQAIQPKRMYGGNYVPPGTAVASVKTLESIIEYNAGFNPSQWPFEPAIPASNGRPMAERLGDIWTTYRWHMRNAKDTGLKETVAELTIESMQACQLSGQPYVMALWDPIGIVKELIAYRDNLLVFYEKFCEENKKKLASANAIAMVRDALHERQLQDKIDLKASERDLGKFYAAPGMRRALVNTGQPKLTEKEELDAKWGAENNWNSNYSRYLNVDLLTAFEKQLKEFEQAVHKARDDRTQAYCNWMNAPLTALIAHDFSFTVATDDCTDGLRFENLCGDLFAGAGSTSCGAKFLDDVLTRSAHDTRPGFYNSLGLTPEGREAVNQMLAQARIYRHVPFTTRQEFLNLWGNIYFPQKLGSISSNAFLLHNANRMRMANLRDVRPVPTGGFEKLILSFGGRPFREFAGRGLDAIGLKLVQGLLLVRSAGILVKEVGIFLASKASVQQDALGAILFSEGLQRQPERQFRLATTPRIGTWEEHAEERNQLIKVWKNLIADSRAPINEFGTYNQARGIRINLTGRIFHTFLVAKQYYETEKDPGNAHHDAIFRASLVALAGSFFGDLAFILNGFKLKGAFRNSIGGISDGTGILIGVYAGFMYGFEDLKMAEKEDAKKHDTLALLYRVSATINFSSAVTGALNVSFFFEPALKALFERQGFAEFLKRMGINMAWGRAVALFSNMWLIVFICLVNILIAHFTPDELQKWLEEGTFGKLPSPKNLDDDQVALARMIQKALDNAKASQSNGHRVHGH